MAKGETFRQEWNRMLNDGRVALLTAGGTALGYHFYTGGEAKFAALTGVGTLLAIGIRYLRAQRRGEQATPHEIQSPVVKHEGQLAFRSPIRRK